MTMCMTAESLLQSAASATRREGYRHDDIGIAVNVYREVSTHAHELHGIADRKSHVPGMIPGLYTV